MFHICGRYGEYPAHTAEKFDYTENTKRLRKYMTDYIYVNQRPPTVAEFMSELQLSQQDVWDSMSELQLGVQLLFVPGTQSIGKVPPFSFYPTRHRVYIEDGREFWAGCAGEACALSAEFPGLTCTVKSICPASWEVITSVWKDGELLSYSPDTTIMHFGVHPRKWAESMVPVCESIDFFTSRELVSAWGAAHPEHRGATITLELAQAWVKQIAGSRYVDYDRGPDAPGAPNFAAGVIASLRAAGADVENWEQGED